MNKVKHLLSVCILSTFIVSGCSSTESVVERERQYSEEVAELIVEKNERENERLNQQLVKVPEWVTSPPRPDETGMYAVGIGESKKLRTSMNSAKLQAEFGLAKISKQELSGQERSYEQDNGGEGVSEQYTAIIDKLVERVSVVGYEVVEQETLVIEGKFRTFTLLKLPFEQFNKVLSEQRRLAKDDKITNAFDNFEKRLEKRRQELLDIKAEQTIKSVKSVVKSDNLNANEQTTSL